MPMLAAKHDSIAMSFKLLLFSSAANVVALT
jgi:hypothetical protein